MPRIHPQDQIDAEFAWVTWLTEFQAGYGAAKPVCRANGILADVTTRTQNYRIPLPPLGSGEDYEDVDGNAWAMSDAVTYELTGLTQKQGPKGLQFTENDLYENMVSAVQMNMNAAGRTLGMWEDRRVALSVLEMGFEKSEQTKAGVRDLKMQDGEPLFSRKHKFRPIEENPPPERTTSNVFDLPLTGDSALAIRDYFGSIRDETGNPAFANMELELTCIVPSTMRSDAEKAFDRKLVAEFKSGGGASVDSTSFKLANTVVLAQLRQKRRWYMCVTNLAMKPVYRVGQKPMTLKERGPNSELWESTQIMRRWHYERADYRATDWRLWTTSERKGP